MRNRTPPVGKINNITFIFLLFESPPLSLTIDRCRIRAIQEACQDLSASFSLQYGQPLQAGRIRSVAVSGHQHGLVLLDEDDEVVRPCMM
jgi:hypothetical protein